tara:strand:- start:190 stop:873 length:684 start_codon:yes stop_codon:yes gene_type:complete
MRIESKLCHLSEDKAVVQVNGWLNDKNVGSALAEGSTVEIAEDKAISRLNNRLNIANNYGSHIKSNNENESKNNVKLPLAKSENIVPTNSTEEPSDWSNELTAIDSEISRLNWSRDDEISFLQKSLGYNNRNKITKYEELISYLNLLKNIEMKDSSKLEKMDLTTMIKESDIILKDLSWDYKKGREYLQKEFNVSTRKELNEEQLLSFVSKLKSIRDQSLYKKEFTT